MIVSSLRRLAARVLDRVADWVDPDLPTQEEPSYTGGPFLSQVLFVPARPEVIEVVQVDPRLETDWDAVEAECAELVHSLEDDEMDGPVYLN